MKRSRLIVLAAFLILAVVVLMLFLLNTSFRLVSTIGSSMEPTLTHGEILVIRKNKQAKNGDMIAFHSEHYDQILIKRVIGSAGDNITVKDGKVYRNDVMLIETYLEPGCVTSGAAMDRSVPANEYYVLGDNRPLSQDSRSAGVGLVQESDVIGVVVCRLWPLKDFQFF